MPILGACKPPKQCLHEYASCLVKERLCAHVELTASALHELQRWQHANACKLEAPRGLSTKTGDLLDWSHYSSCHF